MNTKELCKLCKLNKTCQHGLDYECIEVFDHFNKTKPYEDIYNELLPRIETLERKTLKINTYLNWSKATMNRIEQLEKEVKLNNEWILELKEYVSRNFELTDKNNNKIEKLQNQLDSYHENI